jgi:serine/threonine protein phosphatase 1
MLKFLRRSVPRQVPPQFQGPGDECVYAIGDVHGCAAELNLLLDRITGEVSSHGRASHLVFLGDYVDRGPDSAGVLRRLVEGPLPGVRHSFLLGNHEEAMLAVLDGDLERLPGWLRYGGFETLESYGISRQEALRLRSELPERMREIIPAAHVDFMRSCDDYIQSGDYIFVHAGIRPGIPLPEQEPVDLRWIRDGFLDDDETEHGVMVVHGHTISEEPETRKNRIGIDTGCYQSGHLTALVIEGGDRRFIST